MVSQSREQLIEQIADLIPRLMRGLYAPTPEGRPPPDIRVGELRCLRYVGRLGDPSMSDLCEALHLQPSTVTGLIDGLVGHGVVERFEDTEDRRVVRARLTDEGRRLRDRYKRARRQRLLRLLEGVDNTELTAIRDGLEAMSAAIARQEGCCEGPRGRSREDTP